MDRIECPFCHFEKASIYLGCDLAVAVFDAFPAAEGHMLVIPKRHVMNLFDLPDEEQAAIWNFVGQVRSKLMDQRRPMDSPSGLTMDVQRVRR